MCVHGVPFPPSALAQLTQTPVPVWPHLRTPPSPPAWQPSGALQMSLSGSSHAGQSDYHWGGRSRQRLQPEAATWVRPLLVPQLGLQLRRPPWCPVLAARLGPGLQPVGASDDDFCSRADHFSCQSCRCHKRPFGVARRCPGIAADTYNLLWDGPTCSRSVPSSSVPGRWCTPVGHGQDSAAQLLRNPPSLGLKGGKGEPGGRTPIVHGDRVRGNQIPGAPGGTLAGDWPCSSPGPTTCAHR